MCCNFQSSTTTIGLFTSDLKPKCSSTRPRPKPEKLVWIEPYTQSSQSFWRWMQFVSQKRNMRSAFPNTQSIPKYFFRICNNVMKTFFLNLVKLHPQQYYVVDVQAIIFWFAKFKLSMKVSVLIINNNEDEMDLDLNIYIASKDIARGFGLQRTPGWRYSATCVKRLAGPWRITMLDGQGG